MPGRKSGTSKAQNQMYEFETLSVLSESPNALTISDICARSMTFDRAYSAENGSNFESARQYGFSAQDSK